MAATTFELQFDGRLLSRGFWLYVWQVTLPDGSAVHYVGRTGDNSSINAQSSFNRMGQHLGFAKNSNMLRQWLAARRVDPEHCEFRLVSHGPILEEIKERDEYFRRRDVIASSEKALENAMTDSGYDVLNRVKCRKPLDPILFAHVLNAFAVQFPLLLSDKADLHQIG